MNIIRFMRFDYHGENLGENYTRVIELGIDEVSNKVAKKSTLYIDFTQPGIYGFQLTLVEYFLARGFFSDYDFILN